MILVPTLHELGPTKRTYLSGWCSCEVAGDDETYLDVENPHERVDECKYLSLVDEYSTPQKSNMDTQKLPCLKGVTFSKPSFWVSMLLVFGSVSRKDTECVFIYPFCYRPKQYHGCQVAPWIFPLLSFNEGTPILLFNSKRHLSSNWSPFWVPPPA